MEFEKLGAFYLGREIVGGEEVREPLLYDARDLTTHAVCIGMTGSGKTGLCIDLLEEAALDRVPAIVIDPKGDITNLLLTFPELAPEDFRPWVNPDDARRQGMDLDAFAAAQAALWGEGLARWGQSGDRIRALRETTDFTIYTPGSDAGVPVSVLRSFAAPDADWETEAEYLRERVSGIVSGLLGLAGVDADPVRSREHILLAHLFEHHWRAGRDLDLETLILSVQAPPMRRLGVFDLDAFFPEKDRTALAMRLNALVAAPAFRTWLEGQALDIPSFLASPDGRPRHSIFYIAHLSDAERMFLVTLLLGQVVAWMRTQSGTTSLRALLYMDEVFGFLPPVAEPPSKRPLLTLLKQARAYGLGLVLTTQNPVDLDYKALTNAGTWFLGRLQTERDRTRRIALYHSPDVDAYSEPGESAREFRLRLAQAARECRDAEIDAIEARHKRELESLGERLRRARGRLEQREAEAQARQRETLVSIGESVVGLFLGRRSTRTASASLRKMRMSSSAKGRAEEAEEDVEALTARLAELDEELAAEVAEVTARRDASALELEEVTVTPRRADVDVAYAALVWAPWWRARCRTASGERIVSVPAFA